VKIYAQIMRTKPNAIDAWYSPEGHMPIIHSPRLSNHDELQAWLVKYAPEVTHKNAERHCMVEDQDGAHWIQIGRNDVFDHATEVHIQVHN
jgi:hypothetical protein